MLLIVSGLAVVNNILRPIVASKRLRREQEKFKEPICTLVNNKLSLTQAELDLIAPVLQRGAQRFSDLHEVGAL